jgi:hypothetical protein
MNNPTDAQSEDGTDLLAVWDPKGDRADLHREDRWLGSIRLVDAWFEAGSRIPRRAWVVEWPAKGGETIPGQALIELDAEPVLDDARKAELSQLGASLIGQSAQLPPAPFGVVSTDLRSSRGLRDRIEVISHALQQAEHRLGEAASITEEWGAVKVATALTEALAWLRALDEVLKFAWQRAATEDVREAASLEVDQAMSRRKELPDFALDAYLERQRTGQPYAEWTLLLLDRGLVFSPGQLQGLRWLAGKMLHFGPVPAVELSQWRPGAQPQWKWRQADEIFPEVSQDQRRGQRGLYEKHLAGNSMLATFRLTMMLIEMEHVFFRLIRESNKDSSSSDPNSS